MGSLIKIKKKLHVKEQGDFNSRDGMLTNIQLHLPQASLLPPLSSPLQWFLVLLHLLPDTVKVKSFSRVFATPWTAAYHTPPSMGFSRQEYWSGVPFPSPPVSPPRWHIFCSFKSHSAILGSSLVAQMVKCLPTMWETWVRSLGWEDPLEKEMANHSRILAWKVP